jgi:hypothetical protein
MRTRGARPRPLHRAETSSLHHRRQAATHPTQHTAIYARICLLLLAVVDFIFSPTPSPPIPHPHSHTPTPTPSLNSPQAFITASSQNLQRLKLQTLNFQPFNFQTLKSQSGVWKVVRLEAECLRCGSPKVLGAGSYEYVF